MTRALLLIDIQNDYFADGVTTLSGMEQAADNAARLLRRLRERGDAVYHVQHISTRPQAGFFLPDTPGVDIHPRVAPLNSESLTRKHFPNAFRATTLGDTQRAIWPLTARRSRHAKYTARSWPRSAACTRA